MHKHSSLIKIKLHEHGYCGRSCETDCKLLHGLKLFPHPALEMRLVAAAAMQSLIKTPRLRHFKTSSSTGMQTCFTLPHVQSINLHFVSLGLIRGVNRQ